MQTFTIRASVAVASPGNHLGLVHFPIMVVLVYVVDDVVVSCRCQLSVVVVSCRCQLSTKDVTKDVTTDVTRQATMNVRRGEL